MNRRDFLRLSAGTTLLPLSPASWAVASEGGPKRLVVVMLRGAIDGLNVVVPYAERTYYEVRPTIAIGGPGTDLGALPLDDRFGLHPALPSWRRCGTTESSPLSMLRARPIRPARISMRSSSSRTAPRESARHATVG